MNNKFLTIHRQEAGYRPIHDRIHDFGEVEQTLNSKDRRTQASRCMDCGVPVGEEFIAEIQQYEKEVTSKRA